MRNLLSRLFFLKSSNRFKENDNSSFYNLEGGISPPRSIPPPPSRICPVPSVQKPQIYFDRVGGYSRALPSRATSGSAGYDITSRENYVFPPSELSNPQPYIIHTGIKAVFPPSVVAFLIARSSLFKKTGLILSNSVGVIDADYQYATNGGEIMLSVLNITNEDAVINAGDKVAQVVFVPFLTVETAESFEQERVGGFGSTG
jgi:dUTP pyrophosphatase